MTGPIHWRASEGNAPNWNVAEFTVATLSSLCQNPPRLATMTTKPTVARWRQFVATALAASATAVGALILTAPGASALPESTIKSECKKAGGTYTHNNRTSTCTYKDFKGNRNTDVYECQWPIPRHHNCLTVSGAGV